MPSESAPSAFRWRMRMHARIAPQASSSSVRAVVESFLRPPSLLLSAPRQQICPDERLQIAVDHAVNVADLQLGAVILDHAVRLQDVGTYLRSEFNVEFRVFNLLRGHPLLLHLEFIELRAQHAHGALAVFVLRTLILTTRDQTRRDVCNAHRRISGVHMLSALTAGAICIGANVFRLDHNLYAVVDFGGHKDAGE